MKLHLLHPDGTVSDIAEYKNNPPFEAPEGAEWVEGEPSPEKEHNKPLTLNEKLNQKFKQMIPAHIGQPYLTAQVITDIMVAKQAVTDANNEGLGDFAKVIIQGMSLPKEMTADRDVLLSVFDQ